MMITEEITEQEVLTEDENKDSKELEKATDDLMKELTKKRVNIESYIKKNKNSLIEVNLSKFWSRMIKKSEMTNSNIINKAQLSYYYFYEIINGKKIPSTDKIVCLTLAMHLTLEDCQTALKYCGKASLYPKLKRDSILIYAISHDLTILETNELLDKAGEPILQ